MKTIGDKMEVGDKVRVHTWVSAFTLQGITRSLWQNLHNLPVEVRKASAAGLPATILKVVDSNAVVVRFGDGRFAAVHPSIVVPAA